MANQNAEKCFKSHAELWQYLLKGGTVRLYNNPGIRVKLDEGGVVLDPFGGSGTTAGVAVKNSRKAILCELSEEYTHLVPDRVRTISGYEMPHPLSDLL